MAKDNDYLLYKNIDEAKLTPMMRHYVEEKKKRPDALLFYRLGDFFEMFFDDAITGSKVLGLALTGRECGLETRAPMCGIPHLAVESYVARLVEAGYKVAICEQVEDPSEAQGLVDRQVIRVVTPGTVTNFDNLDTLHYRYIACVYQMDRYYGLAYADVSATRFEACDVITGNSPEKLIDELVRIAPRELVVNAAFANSEACQNYLKDKKISLSLLADQAFQESSRKKYQLSLQAEDLLWSSALAGLLTYLADNTFLLPQKLPPLEPYCLEEYMVLDSTARRHLEITETLRDRNRKGSLLWALDRCQTAMGSRLLHQILSQPLIDLAHIQWRQNCIKAFQTSFVLRQDLIKILNRVYDLERLAGKLSLSSATPRDLLSMGNIQTEIPEIKKILLQFADPDLAKLAAKLDSLTNITQDIISNLVEDAPMKITEGGIFKEGANTVLDDLKLAANQGANWLLQYEKEQKEKTGIKNLKIKYNRVFGYTLEVTKSNLDLVPEEYQRRQTLANSERFFTPELKAMEERILGAEEKALRLEQELFLELRDRVATGLPQLRENARVLAMIDLFSSQAELAEKANFCCPTVVEESVLDIQGGRHPVVERFLPTGKFVANDLYLDTLDHRLMILTGPNMAGKSTYMRQNALIVLMAQAGLFVPARQATIGIVDRIFTRVGASDNLASGESTFMVEMNEVAQILREASPRSLLILDEIGRGTSTWDGLSIAWSVIEHVADSQYIGCRALFATHYHELTELEGMVDGVFNCHVDILLEDDKLEFLHQIQPGGANHSYGIEVAHLAHVPSSVTRRAKGILHMLEEENEGQRLKTKQMPQVMEGQLDLFAMAPSWQTDPKWAEIQSRLKALDLNMMRPLDALAELAQLQEIAGRKEP